jgi:hypothetical protein
MKIEKITPEKEPAFEPIEFKITIESYEELLVWSASVGSLSTNQLIESLTEDYTFKGWYDGHKHEEGVRKAHLGCCIGFGILEETIHSYLETSNP